MCTISVADSTFFSPDNVASRSSNLKYGSSSTVSKAIPISSMPIFKLDHTTANIFGDSDKFALYTLESIVRRLELDLTYLKSEIIKERGSVNHLSDIAGKCVKEIIREYPNAVIEIDTEIAGVSQLSEIHASSHQRPDVTVYEDSFKKKVLLIFDIQSSLMEFTEQKAVLGAANLIRLLRSSKEDFNTATVFTLPNLSEKSCIVEINVRWEKYQFIYTLTCHKDVNEGIGRMRTFLRNYQQFIPSIPRNVAPFYITLASSECRCLCSSSDSCIQLRSTSHIIVECCNSHFIHKIIYDPVEEKTHFHVIRNLTPMDHVITPEIFRNRELGNALLTVYKYQKVRYSPLSAEKARMCLQGLVTSFKVALDELHALQTSHNDARLPNVCFNDKYEAVIIDVDRCYDIEGLHPYFATLSSCMYENFREMGAPIGQFTDYMQLGWMVAWILDNSQDEHAREWEEQKTEIKENKFICALIKNGI